MRSCSAPESVHQTQVFSVLLAFLSFSGTDRFGSARETNAFKRTKFCSLIVQQTRRSLAERFKCKVYDLTAKLFCAVRGEPSWANDLNANDISLWRRRKTSERYRIAGAGP